MLQPALTIEFAMQTAIQDLKVRIRNILHLHVLLFIPRFVLVRALGRRPVLDRSRPVDALL
jgi:hypothetical protein